MEFLENITFRLKSKTIQNTEDSMVDTSCNSRSSPLDGTSSTLPAISDDEDQTEELIQTTKMLQEIESLKHKLQLANEKINNLSTQNYELQQELIELKIKNNNKTSTKVSKKQLAKVQKDIIKPTEISSTGTTTKIPPTNDVTGTSPTTTNNKTTQAPDKTKNIKKYVTKIKAKKICILSSNKTNKILPISETYFHDYQICHYLNPNCGIEKLIDNIHTKLENFDQKDFCFILIGEEDFRRTNNYYDIIVKIRETLCKIQHTNIILCLPTFEYNAIIFNSRIETFNNMLYLDNKIHNYAEILDSNLDLSYDYSMFCKFTGRLNNRGMNNIFQNLKWLVDEYSGDCYTDQASSSKIIDTNEKENTQFFRL